MMKHTMTFSIGSLFCIALATGAGSAFAQGAAEKPEATGADTGPTAPATPQSLTPGDELEDALETVRGAAEVVRDMAQNEGLVDVLRRAKAVYVVPAYARGAFLVGGAGGEGVLLARIDGTWSGPAFYNIGSVNVGLAAGFEAGDIAFILMSQEALDAFDTENNFSLNLDGGLTVIAFSARGQVSAGKGADVVVWSDTGGLYGDIAVSATNIFWDDEANAAYYRGPVSLTAVLNGTVTDPFKDNALRAEFSAFEAR